MSAEHETTELLEQLQILAGCPFLSDLHAEDCRSVLADAVKKLDCGAYSARAWSYAAAYITMQDNEFSDASEARAWLTAYLSE